MGKIKILSVGECSYLSSGYARYNHGLLTQLHKNPNYDVMEYGLSFNPTFHQADTIPWKFYPNVPAEFRHIDSHEKMEGWKEWASNPINALGGPLFNQVLLETQPDIVIANQDEWNLRYILDSPFRRFYKTALLFAHDGIPQRGDWIESMARSDIVMTYSNWAKEQLEENTKVKVFGVPSPSCQSFKPLDRAKTRESFGLNPKLKIIGMVARNQVRKLFPALLSSFRKYLDKTKDETIWLWFHSRYPDCSWDFPVLLQEYNVAHRVLFTYTCMNCRFTYAGPFQDISQCPKCKELSGTHPGANTGITSEDLCRIYNCFDVMTLYSQREGFGIPVVEAAACGIPTMVTNYSSLEDFPKTIGSEPINVKSFSKEIATGQDNAVPDNEHLVELWTKFFTKPDAIRNVLRIKTRRLFELNYGWEKCAQIWGNAIDSVSIPSDWTTPIQLRQPAPKTNQPFDNIGYAKWLISEVALWPERLNSIYESNLVRNLNYQTRADLIGNGIGAQYNRDIAYNEMLQVGHFRVAMELERMKRFGL